VPVFSFFSQVRRIGLNKSEKKPNFTAFFGFEKNIEINLKKELTW